MNAEGLNSLTGARKSERTVARLPNLPTPEWVKLTPDMSGNVVLSLDVRRIPRPNRTMTANWIGVAHKDGDVQLIFGQLVAARTQLTGALIIQIAERQLAKAVHGQATFLASLRGFCDRTHDKRLPLIVSNPSPETIGERVVMERATFAVFSFVESDAELAFHFVSAEDYQRLKHGIRGDFVHPVVEVRVITTFLLALFENLLSIIPPPAADEAMQ